LKSDVLIPTAINCWITIRLCRTSDPVVSVKCSCVLLWLWEQFQNIRGKVCQIGNESRTWKRMHLFAPFTEVCGAHFCLFWCRLSYSHWQQSRE